MRDEFYFIYSRRANMIHLIITHTNITSIHDLLCYFVCFFVCICMQSSNLSCHIYILCIYIMYAKKFNTSFELILYIKVILASSIYI